MTNGGGASEEDRAKRLTEQLGFEVGSDSENITVSALMSRQDHHLQFYAVSHYSEVLDA